MQSESLIVLCILKWADRMVLPHEAEVNVFRDVRESKLIDPTRLW